MYIYFGSKVLGTDLGGYRRRVLKWGFGEWIGFMWPVKFEKDGASLPRNKWKSEFSQQVV